MTSKEYTSLAGDIFVEIITLNVSVKYQTSIHRAHYRSASNALNKLVREQINELYRNW